MRTKNKGPEKRKRKKNRNLDREINDKESRITIQRPKIEDQKTKTRNQGLGIKDQVSNDQE